MKMRVFFSPVVRGVLTLAACLWLPCPGSGAPDLSFFSEVHYNDNLSRTDRQWSGDREDDTALRSTVRAETGHLFENGLRLAAAIEGAAEMWWTTSGLNHFQPRADIAVTRRFGLGPTAPYLRLEAAGGRAFYRESFRDGMIWEGGLAGGRRVHERLAFEAGYRFEDRRARDGFYRSDGHNVFAEVEIAATPRIPVVLGYNFRHGIIHSYTEMEQMELASSRRGMQQTFSDLPWVYRTRLNSHTASATILPVLTETVSLEVGYAFQHSRGSGFRYNNHLLSAGLFFLF